MVYFSWWALFVNLVYKTIYHKRHSRIYCISITFTSRKEQWVTKVDHPCETAHKEKIKVKLGSGTTSRNHRLNKKEKLFPEVCLHQN